MIIKNVERGLVTLELSALDCRTLVSLIECLLMQILPDRDAEE